MTPSIIFSIVSVFGIIAVVVGVYMLRAVKSAAAQKTDIAYVRSLAVRFSYREGLDPAIMCVAMTEALGAIAHVWPVVEISAVLDGVYINVLNVDSWTEPITRRNVAGLAVAGTNSVVVDCKLRALAHELAHLMEAGRGRLPPRIEHDDWEERGIYAAINGYEVWLEKQEKAP